MVQPSASPLEHYVLPRSLGGSQDRVLAAGSGPAHVPLGLVLGAAPLGDLALPAPLVIWLCQQWRGEEQRRCSAAVQQRQLM